MATLGTTEHSRKRHVWTIQVVLMKRIFLTSRPTKSAERCQIFDWHHSKLFRNIRHPFRFLILCSALVYTGIHYRLSQIMSFHVYVETHAKVKFCVKLGMMPTQTNVKMTSAHMNYRVSRKLIFKWYERFREDRESLKNNSRSSRPVNVRWHNLAKSLMFANSF